MIVAAVVGVFVSNPTITSPAFTGFKSATGSYIFPTLFVTAFVVLLVDFTHLYLVKQVLKQIRNESDMLQVGYGNLSSRTDCTYRTPKAGAVPAA